MQSTFKKDLGRARQKGAGVATAGTNFTKPGAHNKGDLCIKASFLRNMVEPGGRRSPHFSDSNENCCGGRFPPKIDSGGHILAKY